MLRWVSMRAFPGFIASFAVAVTLSPAQTVSGSSPLPDVYTSHHRYTARRPRSLLWVQPDPDPCYGFSGSRGSPLSQAFTPSPLTNTSHTSILTGLLPSVHGVTDFAMPLEKTYPTWAELLKQNGYQTAAFIGAVVLDSHTLAPGLDRGFDYYDNFPPGSANGKHWGVVERRGEDVVHRAEAWMDAHSPKAALCLGPSLRSS